MTRWVIKTVWVFFVLVVFAFGFLPFALGFWVKHQLGIFVDTLPLTNPDLRLELVSHESFWTHSDVHYVLYQTDPESNATDRLTIQGRLHHGPVFWQEDGFGLLGLTGDTQYQKASWVTPLPLDSQVQLGFTLAGQGQLQTSTPFRTQTRDGQSFSLDSMKLAIDFDVTGTQLGAKLALEQYEDSLNLRVASSELFLERWQGRGDRLEVGFTDLVVDTEAFGDGDLKFTRASSNGEAILTLEAQVANGRGGDVNYGPGELELTIDQLNADGLKAITDLLGSIPVQEWPLYQAELFGLLPGLLADGARIQMPTLYLQSNQGSAEGRFSLTIPPASGFGLTNVLASEALAELRIDDALAQQWQGSSFFRGFWSGLSDANILVPSNGQRVLDATVSDQVLTINGRTVPLSLGF